MIEKKLQISKLIDFYGKLLSSRQLSIMKAYHEDDLSLSEIAENLNISRQAVLDNIKRAEEFLFDAEIKLQLAKKYEHRYEIYEFIGEHVSNICSINKEILHSDELQKECYEIQKSLDILMK